MNTEQQDIPGKDRQPSCKAKPQIGFYVFAALVVIAGIIYYLIIET